MQIDAEVVILSQNEFQKYFKQLYERWVKCVVAEEEYLEGKQGDKFFYLFNKFIQTDFGIGLTLYWQ